MKEHTDTPYLHRCKSALACESALVSVTQVQYTRFAVFLIFGEIMFALGMYNRKRKGFVQKNKVL